MNKIFEQWLEENEIFDEFLCEHYFSNDINIDEYFEYVDQRNYLFNSFNWGNSRLGAIFWCYTDLKWKTYYTSLL